MSYQRIKRIIDIIGSIIAILLCSWLFIIIIIAIKLDSSGPAIFDQERIGEHGKRFTCYKFRTMYSTSSENKYKPTFNDERVTRVGRHLRRWSLDELPQLWNVLTGDMSLVGPRPELGYFVQHYQDWQWQRFEVKPGMTGWWQINGRKQPMHNFIEEDIYYVDHRSLSLDLRILWSTIWTVINGNGAI